MSDMKALERRIKLCEAELTEIEQARTERQLMLEHLQNADLSKLSLDALMESTPSEGSVKAALAELDRRFGEKSAELREARRALVRAETEPLIADYNQRAEDLVGTLRGVVARLQELDELAGDLLERYASVGIPSRELGIFRFRAMQTRIEGVLNAYDVHTGQRYNLWLEQPIQTGRLWDGENGVAVISDADYRERLAKKPRRLLGFFGR